MLNSRLCNRTQLREIVEKATKRSYNRVLPNCEIEELNDDTMVVVRPVLIHEFAQGKPVEPHLRCIVEWGENLEYGGFQDVPFEMIDGLLKVNLNGTTDAVEIGG